MHCPRLLTIASLIIFASAGMIVQPIAAQDAKSDPFWQHFDERFPEIAGQAEALWAKAAEIAAVQFDPEKEPVAFASRQNLVFHALAVNERDQAIMRKEAKTKAEHDWILSRRDANRQFEKDVETIKTLRAKADGDLTQDDMKAILQTTVSLMQYIYEAQIQANESYLDSVVQDNQSLRDKLAEAENQLETQPKPKPETQTESNPSGSSREAKSGDFKAYLQSNRIVINEEDRPLVDRRKEHDRNHVQITGAIKNQTDKPARFRFQVYGLRADKRVVGLTTITTGVIPPGGVEEIDTKMPVEHSAYVRSVDMREVTVITP